MGLHFRKRQGDYSCIVRLLRLERTCLPYMFLVFSMYGVTVVGEGWRAQEKTGRLLLHRKIVEVGAYLSTLHVFGILHVRCDSCGGGWRAQERQGDYSCIVRKLRLERTYLWGGMESSRKDRETTPASTLHVFGILHVRCHGCIVRLLRLERTCLPYMFLVFSMYGVTVVGEGWTCLPYMFLELKKRQGDYSCIVRLLRLERTCLPYMFLVFSMYGVTVVGEDGELKKRQGDYSCIVRKLS